MLDHREHMARLFADHFGSPPAKILGLFGLGLERTLAWITGCPHVRELIPFPRLMNRLTPRHARWERRLTPFGAACPRSRPPPATPGLPDTRSTE